MSFDIMDYGQDFQHLMLSVLMSEPDIYVRCQNILKPEYFDNKYAKATNYILEYSHEYSTLPTSSEVTLKSGVSLDKISDITVENHAGFLDTFEDFCRHKAIEHAVIEGMKLVQSKRYGKVEDMVKEAMMVSLQKNLGTDYFANPEERNNRLFESQGNISTGWKDVDFKLFGGFGTGELEIFVAPSGGGKSVALQNISMNFAKQKMNGIYITLELKEELVAQRIDSMMTGRGKKDLIANMGTASAEIMLKGKNMGDFWIKRMPESTTTVHDIKAYVRELQIKTGIKLDYIAVDYLDLLSSPRVDVSDTFNKDKYVCEELRALAAELDITLVTASQLNRSAVEAEEYSHANIAGGISKIYTADNVIGIRNTQFMRERGELQFEFLKTRNSNGVGQSMKLGYNIDTLEIYDHPEGNSASFQPSASAATPAQQALQPQNTVTKPATTAATGGAVTAASQLTQASNMAANLRNLVSGIR